MSLTADQAVAVAALLTGARYSIGSTGVDPVDAGDVAIETVTLRASSPAGALVVLLRRDGGFVVPQGGTVLRGGDEALVLADAETLPQVRTALDGSGSQGQTPC